MGKPVVHFDIGCRDKEKISEFYCTLFDWSRSDYGPYSQRIATGADKGIEGFVTSLGHEPHNYVMLYVEVDDIPAYTKRVEELGGKVLIPETEAPGQGHFAWLADPEGNMFGLWKPLQG